MKIGEKSICGAAERGVWGVWIGRDRWEPRKAGTRMTDRRIVATTVVNKLLQNGRREQRISAVCSRARDTDV